MSPLGGAAFAGLDLGTSGVRAAVFGPDGRMLAQAGRELPVRSVEPGQAEVEPEAAAQAALDALQEALQRWRDGDGAGRLEGLGLSAALFSVLGVDGAGRPVTPVYTWMDRRASEVLARHGEEGALQGLYARTGCPLHALYPLAKIRWLREVDPDRFRRVARFVSLKEYLLHRLFGVWVVDVSLASGTGCFDIAAHRWDPDALAWAGIRPGQLSEVVDAAHALRGMDPRVARALGVPAELPVAVGAGDGMLAHVAVAGAGGGRFSCTVGTSGAVRVLSRRPLLDAQRRTWCYCLDREHWVAGGAINNGGIVLRWLRELLRQAPGGGGPGWPYAEFDRLAQASSAGARGLLFVPLLTGERSPRWDDRASGLLVGLRLDHTLADVVRAAMEGVVFRLRQVYEALVGLVGAPGELRAGGGYARSPVWLQMQADVFGQPVLRPAVAEASALGAAMAAMRAVGALSGWEEVERLIRIEASYLPREAAHARYRRAFELFLRAYEQGIPLFEGLAAFAGEPAAG